MEKIRIVKRPVTTWIAYYILIMALCLSFLTAFLNFPSIIKYTVDVAWVLAMLILIAKGSIRIEKKLFPFFALVGVWLLFVLVVYMLKYQSPFYFLWGIRNNFRLYAAFFAFTLFFDTDDVSSLFRVLDVFFWINAPMAFYQFFVLGLRQDYLGGIFGAQKGCNAYSLMLFIVVITRSLLMFMEGKERGWVCALKNALALIISAMAEIKFFFVIFVIILVITAMMTGFSWRKVVLFSVLAFFITVANSILAVTFGEGYRITLETVINFITVDTYATATDLGRFTAIPRISSDIFTSLGERLVGYGLGNCDTSSFEICNTPFYRVHGETLHYTWFSSAMLFLETGYLGLFLNLSFYALSFFGAYVRKKRGEGNALFCNIGMIISIVCVIMTFYNSTLRTEIGYIAYFGLALPFVDHPRKSLRKGEPL